MRARGEAPIGPGDCRRRRSLAGWRPPAAALSPGARPQGTHQAVLDEIRKAGFVRARVDGQVYELEEEIQMDRYKIHTIEAVVDRLVIHQQDNEEETDAFRSRLTDSVETALKFGDGYLTIQDLTDPERPHDLHFSEHLACPEHGSVLPEIEPRTFSFNTPHGACRSARAWVASSKSTLTC